MANHIITVEKVTETSAWVGKDGSARYRVVRVGGVWAVLDAPLSVLHDSVADACERLKVGEITEVEWEDS